MATTEPIKPFWRCRNCSFHSRKEDVANKHQKSYKHQTYPAKLRKPRLEFYKNNY